MATPLCEDCKASGMAIMPVLYAVVPKTVSPALPGWAGAGRIKDVPTGSEFHYALRTLRAGFVYLFYSKNAFGANQWETYAVTLDGMLIKQPTPAMAKPVPEMKCSTLGHSDARLRHLIIQRPDKCGPTWIAFSEHAWSEETIKSYTDNSKLRDARMQTIHPAAMAKGSKHSHGTVADVAALEGVLEYASVLDTSKLPHESATGLFSKEDGSYEAVRLSKVSTRTPWHLRKDQAQQDLSAMQARCKKSDGSSNTPHVLALWDAIGITHELNGYRNDAAGWLKKYGDERELQMGALSAIEGVKKALENRTEEEMQAQYQRSQLATQTNQNGPEGIAALRQMAATKGDPRYAEAADLLAQWEPALVPSYYTRQLNGFLVGNKGPRWRPAVDQLKTEVNSHLATRDANKQKNLSNAKNKAWAKYETRLDMAAQGNFKKQWDSLLTKADAVIDSRTEVLVKWLEAQLLIDTLEDFHPNNITDGVLFEDVVGDAVFGIGSSKAGAAKLDAWAKEAKASVKSNLLWRAIALNQQEGVAEVDAALQTALSQTTPLTVAAWNVAMSNLKNLQRLADTYKKAQGVYDGNLKAGSTAGSSAFGVRLKPINTRGVDRIVITAGDAIFRAFRIDKAGDLVSEKIIQHLFCVRAYVDPIDSLRLVAAQAKEQKLADADILRRIRTAKVFLGADVPKSQQTASLAEAWDKIRDGKSGPTAIKDARLAVVVMLIETGNFAKMFAQSKGDGKTQAMLAASAMSITAAVLDIASVPAKNIWGNEAATYQKLKLLGGLLGGMASLVGAGVDYADTARQFDKGRWGLATLYGLKTIAGAGGGLLTLATSFSYGAGVLQKISGRAAVAQAARATSAVATRVIAARILMMSVGAWVTVITIGLQVLIWVFTPDELEDWCEGCAFGPQDRRKGWTPRQQMDEFDKALVEVL